jgi:hypothetical protein
MNLIITIMKRYIKTPLKYTLPLLCIGSLVLVSISGCTSSTNTSSPTPTYVPKSTLGYLNYTNSSAGVAIQYPPSWNATEGGNHTVLFSLPPGLVTFGVDAQSTRLSLDEYVQLTIQNLGQCSTAKLLNSNNITLAGYPAHKFVTTAVIQGNTLQTWWELTVVDRTAYILAYQGILGAYSDNSATANNMFQSFHLVK